MTLQQFVRLPEAANMATKNWLPPGDAGGIIKKARERSGLTQDQVAEGLGVDKSYISKLESGLHHAGRSKYFPQLVGVLSLTESEIRELNPSAVFVLPDQEERYSNGSPIKPVVQWADDETLMEIPETLQRVLDRLSKDYTELADTRSVKSILPRFLDGGGPQTEEEWRDYILGNLRWIRRAKN